jgi:hypothetical protein
MKELPSARAVLAALEESFAGGVERYDLRGRVTASFVARTVDGGRALLIPLARPGPSQGRICGSLTVSFLPLLRFNIDGRVWEAPGAIVESREEALASTFSTLAFDVAETLGAESPRPPARAVLAALARWERLFRARHVLSDAEELGLWGELWVIRTAANPNMAVEAWQGPGGERRDFLANELSVEVKTSQQRLRHHISLDQVERPSGDTPSYLASLWVALDPAAGTSLPELVEQIRPVVEDLPEFEKKLLTVGYGGEERALYSRRFRVLESPMVFSIDSVPRVRSVDPGISEVRYVMTLDEDRALMSNASQELLRQLGQ